MNYYTMQSLQDLIARYAQAGGEVVQYAEGGVGLGTVILRNNGLPLKEYVIKERYLNEWSSTHTCTTYTEARPLPKKYADFSGMDDIYDELMQAEREENYYPEFKK